MDTRTIAAKQLLDKACLDLLRHPETRMFAPFFVSGDMSVEPDATKCPTAYTDGSKEIYGVGFLHGLPNIKQVRFLILHEKGHKFLLHFLRVPERTKANPRLRNIAADYAVNGMIIDNIKAPDLIEMIPTALYDAEYTGWAYEDIFDDLVKKEESNGGSGGEPLDSHDYAPSQDMTDEQKADEIADITESLRQGAMMAGTASGDRNLSVENALAPRVSWRTELQEFFTEVSSGRDELTFRKYNRRALADDRYLPSWEAETLDEIVVAFDVSGSMLDMIPVYAAALEDLAVSCQPSKLRVLFWDTQVAAEQVFTSYDGLARKLKPVGGGGTRAGCVSEYILTNKIAASAVLMFTDGECEPSINWNVTCPTLWFVHGYMRTKFAPPAGRVVRVED